MTFEHSRQRAGSHGLESPQLWRGNPIPATLPLGDDIGHDVSMCRVCYSLV